MKMTTTDALALVLELAEGNVLEDDQIDDEDSLVEEQKKQQKAINIVYKLLKNRKFVDDYR